MIRTGHRDTLHITSPAKLPTSRKEGNHSANKKWKLLGSSFHLEEDKPGRTVSQIGLLLSLYPPQKSVHHARLLSAVLVFLLPKYYCDTWTTL